MKGILEGSDQWERVVLWSQEKKVFPEDVSSQLCAVQLTDGGSWEIVNIEFSGQIDQNNFTVRVQARQEQADQRG